MSTAIGGTARTYYPDFDTGTTSMPPTVWVSCSPIDHNFSAVLDWVGGISQIAGFLCSKCGEFRPTPELSPETGEAIG